MIEIKDKKDCCGCLACYSVCKRKAIKLTTDEQGFLYPQVDKNLCIDCGLCERVCPVVNSEKRNPGYKKIYALRVKDEDVLKRSSSGGAFYALASYVISEFHGVVFGVKYNEKMVVCHAFSETLEGLKSFQGSKYVQSNIEGIYEQVKSFLKTSRVVLFTGTPCQVMALRLYLKKDYENLICIDIICHSVSSPIIFKEYVEFVNSKYPGNLIKIDMRNKTKGWSHAFYYYYYYYSDGSNLGDDKLKCEHWGKLFFSGLITRPSCNDCKFTSYRRAGDITIADFWDDKLKRPEAYSSKGTSLFIVSTDKGAELLSNIEDTVNKWELTQNEAFQPCLKNPVSVNSKRDEFWKYHNLYGFKKTYNKYFKTPLKIKSKMRLKSLLKKSRIYPVLKYLKRKAKNDG